jgi:hypothetical protein
MVPYLSELRLQRGKLAIQTDRSALARIENEALAIADELYVPRDKLFPKH